MTMRWEELERIEREAREPEPQVPFPEPAVLALQRTAGNQATARFLQRQPTLTVDNKANDLRLGARLDVVRRARRRGPQDRAGNPDPVGRRARLHGLRARDSADGRRKVRDASSRRAIEELIRARAKQQGIVLLDHRDPADVRGLQAEATAILGNLGRMPTELTFGNTTRTSRSRSAAR